MRGFDLLPLVLTAADWRGVEAGLVQRARLLEAVLTDIYGPQRLLADRRLPPALVHANARFARAARVGDAARPRRALSLYAADLARDPDGRWTVLADHTGMPLGAGFALLNRRTTARALPEGFRAMSVRQIAPFFEQMQDSLQRLATTRQPRLALLTPGPASASYFEHAFLARELGIALVEGRDLTIGQAGVGLKTLGGVRPVDVLLRRLDSSLCDPLELRADSMLGIPGLADAERAGSVAIANPLGSGAGEVPALSPFLPGLCGALLGEALAMPATDVWWAGEPAARDYIFANLADLVAQPAFDRRQPGIVVSTLTGHERDRLATLIRDRPHAWTARRPVVASVAPTWTPAGLQPTPVVLRVFLVATDTGWMAMPGGLACDAATGPTPMADGAGTSSRDVWVLAEDATDVFLPPAGRFQNSGIRRDGDLQSRVADDLFWLGRYTERLDNAARLLRAALRRLARAPLGARDLAELRCLGRALSDARLLDPQAALAPPETGALGIGVAHFGTDGGKFQDTLSAIRRLADAARHRLSTDMSSTVDELIGEVSAGARAARGDVDRLIAVLDGAIRFVATFSGLAQENVTRGDVWRFLDLGRRVERGTYICYGALSAFLQTPVAWDSAMRLALELCDSTMTYRGRYLAATQPAPTLDLVLLDHANPRSLAFQLRAIGGHLDDLAATTGVRAAFDAAGIVADATNAVLMFGGD